MAYIITDNCTSCGICIQECPVNAISEGEICKINPDICTECGYCIDFCPNDAIQPK